MSENVMIEVESKKEGDTERKTERKDSYSFLHCTRLKIFEMSFKIINFLPFYLACDFFKYLDHINSTSFYVHTERIDKKFFWLIKKEHKFRISNIKPISYVCSFDNESRTSVVSGSLPKENNMLSSEVIHISADKFGEALPLDSLNNKWFFDLSDIDIPLEVKYLLQLGESFGLPINKYNFEHTFIEFIKSIESNIVNRPNNVVSCIRNITLPILDGFQKNSQKKDPNSNLLTNWITHTKKFISEHPEIMFSKADKGNVTVAQNKVDYINKMEVMLSDKNTYETIKKDPTKKLTTDLRSVLVRWKNRHYIDDYVYKSLLTTDGNIPRAYGLTKIHKNNYPLRIIVSSINSPLYKLSFYLHKIIRDSLPEFPSFLKNSADLIDKIKNVKLDSDSVLVSLDVVSLFTNIPIELACDSVTRKWESISVRTGIPFDEFLIAFRLVLNSTYFMFNNKFYKQIFGTPMGSPLSPVVADLVMHDLEESAIRSLPTSLTFYYRYVDDIILAAPSEHIDEILNVFNSLHPRLQFTMEVGEDGKLNFLDTLIIVRDGGLIFDGYRKSTFSGRYLNYHSHHPICHKRGVLCGVVDKIILYCHPLFQQDNLTNAINNFLSNGYPIQFIFSTINNRLKFHINNINSNNNNNSILKKFFTIPFVNTISDKFKPVANMVNCKLAYTIPNTLGNYIKRGKDKLKHTQNQNVVYKISCDDCEASYVGQTKRQLKTRLHEHVSDINKVSVSPSVITNHRINENHNFNWKKVEILDIEPSYNKRLISEMVHIKKQKHGINKQNDTESLPDMYTNMIHSLSTS